MLPTWGPWNPELSKKSCRGSGADCLQLKSVSGGVNQGHLFAADIVRGAQVGASCRSPKMPLKVRALGESESQGVTRPMYIQICLCKERHNIEKMMPTHKFYPWEEGSTQGQWQLSFQPLP